MSKRKLPIDRVIHWVANGDMDRLYTYARSISRKTAMRWLVKYAFYGSLINNLRNH